MVNGKMMTRKIMNKKMMNRKLMNVMNRKKNMMNRVNKVINIKKIMNREKNMMDRKNEYTWSPDALGRGWLSAEQGFGPAPKQFPEHLPLRRCDGPVDLVALG